jgi:hypothetical protein
MCIVLWVNLCLLLSVDGNGDDDDAIMDTAVAAITVFLSFVVNLL